MLYAKFLTHSIILVEASQLLHQPELIEYGRCSILYSTLIGMKSRVEKQGCIFCIRLVSPLLRSFNFFPSLYFPEGRRKNGKQNILFILSPLPHILLVFFTKEERKMKKKMFSVLSFDSLAGSNLQNIRPCFKIQRHHKEACMNLLLTNYKCL